MLKNKLMVLTIVAAISGLVGGILGNYFVKPTFAGTKPVKKEYKVAQTALMELEPLLNKMASEGWVYDGSIASASGGYPFLLLIFSR